MFQVYQHQRIELEVSSKFNIIELFDTSISFRKISLTNNSIKWSAIYFLFLSLAIISPALTFVLRFNRF